MDYEPPVMATDLLISSRNTENKIDMALEMMDVNSMDIGRYRAMVVQDPEDRQNITGFVRFAHVLSARGVEFGSGGINTYPHRQLYRRAERIHGTQSRLRGLYYDR